MSFGRYVFLYMKVYCYRPDEISRFPRTIYCLQYVIEILVYLYGYTIKLLLTEILVHRGNICSDVQGVWTERTRRMDLTAFAPYALNVRTNISSYGPRARLIRAYYINFTASLYWK